jgi:hypothetical protein
MAALASATRSIALAILQYPSIHTRNPKLKQEQNVSKRFDLVLNSTESKFADTIQELKPTVQTDLIILIL